LINSYIYKWNGTNFSLSQNIPTLGGFRFDYFEIGGDKYLGVANNRNNSTYSVNSYIYKYNPSTSLFDTSSVFINIPSLAARSIEHFSIDEYDYIFVSNTQGTESTIYKLN